MSIVDSFRMPVGPAAAEQANSTVLQIYDASVDELRAPTQKDIDDLVMISRMYGQLVLALRNITLPELPRELRSKLIADVYEASRGGRAT